MRLYKRKTGQPLKWLVAAIVFALAMGVTFTDVYGGGTDGSLGTNSNPGGVEPADNGNGNISTGNDEPIGGGGNPTAIPEPTTLILLAGGLSALYVARRRKSHRK
jgi:hypothetical protein